MSINILEPIDTCGCGDTGYLTTRTIPIDLAHGVGKIHHVPVYHCKSDSCPEYTIPPEVSRYLEDLAEKMEAALLTEIEYDGKSAPDVQNNLAKKNAQLSLVQAFTLKFINREYEDTHVTFVIPGEAIFFQNIIDKTENYVLRYQPDLNRNTILFSLAKFYYDVPNLTYENFLDWSQDGHVKELAVLSLDEVEDALLDEFGEIT